MKKIIIALIGILFAGFIGIGFLQFNKEKQVVRSYPPLYSAGEKKVASFIPDGAAIVFFVKGLGEKWEQLLQASFFRQLVESQTSPLISSFGPLKENAGIKEKAEHFLDEETILGAFGQDVSVAVYPSEKKEEISFLVVSKTSPLFKVKELIYRQYHKYIGVGSFVTHRLGKFSASTIPAALYKPQVHYALVDGKIIVSNSIDKLRDSLGIAEGREIPAIVHSPTYTEKVEKSLAGTRYGMYVENEKLEELLELTTDSEINNEDISSWIESSFSKITLKNGIHAQTKFFTKPEKQTIWQECLTENPVEIFQGASFIPSNAMLYLGVKGIDAYRLLDAISDEFLKGNPLAQTILSSRSSEGENSIEAKRKEIFSVLGSDWNLAVMEKGTEPSLFPGVVAAAEVKNVQQAANIIEEFLGSEKKALLSKRSYKDLEINQLEDNKIFRLEYFFYDNYLIFCTDEHTSNIVIDTINQETPSFLQGKANVAFANAPDSNFLFHLDVEKIFDFSKTNGNTLPLGLWLDQGKNQASLQKKMDLFNAVGKLSIGMVFTPEEINANTFVSLKDPSVVAKKIKPQQIPTLAKPLPPEPKKPSIVPPTEKSEEKTVMVPTEEKAASPVEPEPQAVEKNEVLPPSEEKLAKNENISLEGKLESEEASEKPINQEEETGKAASETAEEDFAYSGTYKGKAKQDPFASLIDLELAQVSQTVDLSSLWKRLSKIEPINLYVFKYVQRHNPKLISKIEKFTRDFRNTKKLGKMSGEEVTKNITEYSSTVAKLNKKYKSKIIHPLNFDLDTLALVGIIQGEKNNFALIQTGNQKGYTLYVKNIIGANFGEIVSITKSKVIIEEKWRDYRGKISTETKVFELKKEEG